MITGVIFDLDGVILDSLSIWKRFADDYLTEQGITPEEALWKKLFSMSLEQGASYLQKNYLPALTDTQIQNGLQERLFRYYAEEIREKEGMRAVFSYLYEKHIPMVIATSSPRTHAIAALTRLALLPYFSGILTTSEIGQSKHTPTIYQKAAEMLRTEAAQTLVAEDSLYALQTAKAAGFTTVGIKDEWGEPDQTMLRQTADLYIEKTTDLLSVLKDLIEPNDR